MFTFPVTIFGGGEPPPVDWNDYDGSHNSAPANLNGTTNGRGAIAIQLSNRRILIIYRNTSTDLRALVARVSTSGTVTLGSSTAIWTGTVTSILNQRFMSVTMLDSNTALVTFLSLTNGLLAVAFKISGNAIGTVGASATITAQANNNRGTSVSALSSSSAICCYSQNTDATSYMVTLSVDGSLNITVNTPVVLTVLSGNNDDSLSVIALSSTQAIAFYLRTSLVGAIQRPFPYADLISISGTVPSTIDTLQISAALDASNFTTVGSLSSLKISSTTIVGMWTLATGRLVAIVITSNGSTLSKGSQSTFDNTARFAANTSMSLQDEENIFVGYSDGVSAVNLRSGVMDISGTTLTPVINIENSTSSVGCPIVCKVSQQYAFFLYNDVTDSNVTKYILCTP